MVERRQEFPALEARRSFLEQAYYQAQRQADDAVFAGKPDNATQQWLANVRTELDELNYLLKAVGSQGSKIDVTGHTLFVSMVAYAFIMAIIVIVFLRYYGV